MGLQNEIFDIVCDAPGITPRAILDRVMARRKTFLRLFFRPLVSVLLWMLEDDAQISYVDGKAMPGRRGRRQRHYYPADTGRFTDHRL